MKTFKLLTVMLFSGLAGKCHRISHNMLVAQKMLNAKEKSIFMKAETKALPLQLTAKPTAVKPATHPATESAEEETTLQPEAAAVSLSQHIARWVVRIVSVSGEVLGEKLVSLFSASDAANLPANAYLVSLTNNVLSYLVRPLRDFVVAWETVGYY